MICKICNREINLHIFGVPEDICYGCLEEKEQDEISEFNLKLFESKEESSAPSLREKIKLIVYEYEERLSDGFCYYGGDGIVDQMIRDIVKVIEEN